jgi:hypothetical protein
MKCAYCGHDKPSNKKQRRFVGEPPYGLQVRPGRPREYEKCHEEVATIDTVCHRWRQGDSLRAICRWLDGIGVLNRSGKPWHPTQIKRILEREGAI